MKKQHRLFLALFITLSVGCATKNSSSNHPPVTWTKSSVTTEEESAAKSAVVSQLKDPDSVRFGKFWAMDGTNGQRTICGYVNAKNSFGGYTGMKVFNIFNNNLLIEGSGPLGLLVPSMCKPRTVK